MHNAVLFTLVIGLTLPAASVARDAPAIAFARIGQSVVVDGPSVTPLAVIEDSRCPPNVTCVWAGEVRIRVRIGFGKRARVKELSTRKPLPVADGTLMLVSVLTPKARPSGYLFGFRFEGGL